MPGAKVEQAYVSNQEVFEPVAREAARRYGIPEDVYVKLIGAESAWQTDVIYGQRVSSAGATGIAQFLPSTAASLGINPNNPYQALDGGARYLRQNLDFFGGDIAKAVAAYNAGPGGISNAVTQAQDSKRGTWVDYIPQETALYLSKIFGSGETQVLGGSGSYGPIGLQQPLQTAQNASGTLGVAPSVATLPSIPEWTQSLGKLLAALVNPQVQAKAAFTAIGVVMVVGGTLVYVLAGSPVTAVVPGGQILAGNKEG